MASELKRAKLQSEFAGSVSSADNYSEKVFNKKINLNNIQFVSDNKPTIDFTESSRKIVKYLENSRGGDDGKYVSNFQFQLEGWTDPKSIFLNLPINLSTYTTLFNRAELMQPSLVWGASFKGRRWPFLANIKQILIKVGESSTITPSAELVMKQENFLSYASLSFGDNKEDFLSNHLGFPTNITRGGQYFTSTVNGPALQVSDTHLKAFASMFNHVNIGVNAPQVNFGNTTYNKITSPTIVSIPLYKIIPMFSSNNYLPPKFKIYLEFTFEKVSYLGTSGDPTSANPVMFHVSEISLNPTPYITAETTKFNIYVEQYINERRQQDNLVYSYLTAEYTDLTSYMPEVKITKQFDVGRNYKDLIIETIYNGADTYVLNTTTAPPQFASFKGDLVDLSDPNEQTITRDDTVNYLQINLWFDGAKEMFFWQNPYPSNIDVNINYEEKMINYKNSHAYNKSFALPNSSIVSASSPYFSMFSPRLNSSVIIPIALPEERNINMYGANATKRFLNVELTFSRQYPQNSFKKLRMTITSQENIVINTAGQVSKFSDNIFATEGGNKYIEMNYQINDTYTSQQ